ncbi:flagellar hook-associated protein FlgL [Sedimentibacter sp.]|uniref:flagellar hook-associated protein FlgL n=1 Tax=Sedimentibacter sp. TaxID=1960295 RepID=UPI0028AEFE58|nr:flagellar hook-associated protein FlgL [Sedimentibacter sp.]
MRITTSMMTSRYMRNLNKSANQMNYLNERAATQMKFFKGSEDPVSAIKAYKLRREYRKTEQYDTNISDANSFLTAAETNMMEIGESIKSVNELYIRGITGTMGKEEREAIAKELDNLQSSILASLNGKFEDRYVLGGTSRDELPFTVHNNQLYYKGVNVNTGLDKDNQPVGANILEELANEKSFVDLGLGLTFNGNKLAEDTAFNVSTSGIGFLGYGYGSETDAAGDPIANNIYTLIGNIKDELRKDDFSYENISPYLSKFEKQKNEVLVAVTDIGAKTNYLEFLQYRNEDNQINLNKKILEVEKVDPAEAIVDFKMQEYAYNAALAMGNKILQNSFIDFMK